MRISPELKWLGPYLESVETLVPLDHVVSIMLSSRKNPKNLDYTAITYKHSKTKYSIVFPVSKQERKDFYEVFDHSAQRRFLHDLAHELTHCLIWEDDHNANQFNLEATLYKNFSEVLLKLDWEYKRNKVN